MLSGSGGAVEPARPRVLLLEVKAPITTGTTEYVEAGLARAKAEGFQAVAIVLDTPGGHLDATREVVQKMLASDVPILVWVGPAGARAGSAGVFITLAADVAAMHPASNIGAAHPVLGGGEDVEKQAGKEMARKIENDTAAVGICGRFPCGSAPSLARTDTADVSLVHFNFALKRFFLLLHQKANLYFHHVGVEK
jgi:membrane-bound serine protease (ClpP class)